MCVHVKQICSKSGILWLIDRGRHAGPWASGLLAVPWGRGPGSRAPVVSWEVNQMGYGSANYHSMNSSVV